MILILINLAFGIAIAYMQLKCYAKVRLMNWGWIRLASGILGLVWAGLYTYLFYIVVWDPAGAEIYQSFVSSSVRPAITVTLAIMLAQIIITQREN